MLFNMSLEITPSAAPETKVTDRTSRAVPCDASIELSSRVRHGRPVSQDLEEQTPVPVSSNPPSDSISLPRLKLLSAGFSFFVAGTNDGSMGPLLPYILKDYRITTSFVAILYSPINSTIQKP